MEKQRRDFGRTLNEATAQAISTGVPALTVASDLLAMVLTVVDTHGADRAAALDLLQFHAKRLQEIARLAALYED